MLLNRGLVTRVAADAMTIQSQDLGNSNSVATEAGQTVRDVLGYLSDLEFYSLWEGLAAAGPVEGNAVC